MASAIQYRVTLWDDEISVSVYMVYDNIIPREEIFELKHFDKGNLEEALEWVREKAPSCSKGVSEWQERNSRK